MTSILHVFCCNIGTLLTGIILDVLLGGKSQSRAQLSFSSKAGLFKINGPKQGPYQNTWQSKRRGLAVGTAGHFPAEDLEHMAYGIIEHHNPAGLLVVLRSGHRRSHNQNDSQPIVLNRPKVALPRPEARPNAAC